MKKTLIPLVFALASLGAYSQTDTIQKKDFIPEELKEMEWNYGKQKEDFEQSINAKSLPDKIIHESDYFAIRFTKKLKDSLPNSVLKPYLDLLSVVASGQERKYSSLENFLDGDESNLEAKGISIGFFGEEGNKNFYGDDFELEKLKGKAIMLFHYSKNGQERPQVGHVLEDSKENIEKLIKKIKEI